MCNECGCSTPWMGCTPDLRKTSLSFEEVNLISKAVNSALCWGLSLTEASRTAVEDAGFEWTEEHEQFVFDNFVASSYS